MDWQRIRLAATETHQPWQVSNLITMVREVTGLDLQAANAFVESGGVLVDGLSPSEARRVAQRFINPGYPVEVEPSPAYEPVRCVDVREPTFAARVCHDPADVAAHLVYADWLQAHGNPLGELIALQVELARAEGEARLALEARDRVFRQGHARALFGPLHGVAAALVQRWSLGFIEAATVGLAGHDHATAPIRLLPELLRLPVAARMGALSLPYKGLRRRDIDRVLCRSDVVARLRTLELRDSWTFGDLDQVLNFAKLWAHMRGLETLIVHGDEPPLREVSGVRLRHLQLILCGFPQWHFRGCLPSESIAVETLTVEVTEPRGTTRSFHHMFSLPWIRAETFVVVVRDWSMMDRNCADTVVNAARVLGARRLDLSRCGVGARALAGRSLDGVELILPQPS